MKRMLIVTDMLKDFIRQNGALYVPGSEKIVPHVANLLDMHRSQGNTIIFICDAHKPDDKEFDRFPKHSVFGTDGAEIIPELEFGKTAKEYKLLKTRYSGFYNTDLKQRVIASGADEVDVCGVCTSICVTDTIGGLSNMDIPTRVHLNTVHDLPPLSAPMFPGVKVDMHVAALIRMSVIYGTHIIT